MILIFKQGMGLDIRPWDCIYLFLDREGLGSSVLCRKQHFGKILTVNAAYGVKD